MKAIGNQSYNYASRESTIAYSNWSFDVFLTESEMAHFYIDFIGDDWSDDADIIFNASGIMIVTQRSFMPWGFYLFKYMENPIGSNSHAILDEYADYKMNLTLDQWYHFDITRLINGRFSVYIDSILRLTAKDQSYTTSSYFRFMAKYRPALDNIIVTGVVDPISSETSSSESESSVNFIPISIWIICFSILGRKSRKLKLM